MNASPLSAALLASALFVPALSFANGMTPSRIEPCPIMQSADQALPLPDDCLPPPPPPPPVPAKPKAIWYTPFSESSKVKVQWRSSSYATYYKLNRIINGSTATVYSGSQTKWTGNVGSEGEYRFTVSACNSSGCSSAASQTDVTVSYGPRGNTTQALANGKFDELMTTQGFVAQIGMGYDRLRQELVGDICLNTTTANVQTINNRSKTFNLSLSKTREEYFRSLNLEENLSVGGAYSSFSGSFSGKKSLAATAKRVEDTHILTASFVDRHSTTQMTNGATLPFDSTYMGWLVGGLPGHFRNSCGDAYVSSYDTGREATLTFQMQSDDFSSSEVRTRTAEMKVAIGNYVSGGYQQTKREEINNSYSKYGVQVYLLSTGSGAEVASVITLDAALDYLRRFEQEPSNQLVVYNYGTTDYLRPSSVPVSAWPDYKPKRNILERWYRFDNQVSFRCTAFELPDSSGPEVDKFLLMNDYATSVAGAVSNPHVVCRNTKRALQLQIQNCEDTDKWGSCIQPDSASCPVSGSSLSCLNYAKQLPLWINNDATLSLDRELGSGLTDKCETESGNICLTNSALSIVDLRPRFIDCAGKGGCPAERDGVTVETTELHRASSASNSINASSKCLTASAKVCRPGWWKSGARIHQKQTLHGLQMLSSREYSF